MSCPHDLGTMSTTDSGEVKSTLAYCWACLLPVANCWPCGFFVVRKKNDSGWEYSHLFTFKQKYQHADYIYMPRVAFQLVQLKQASQHNTRRVALDGNIWDLLISILLFKCDSYFYVQQNTSMLVAMVATSDCQQHCRTQQLVVVVTMLLLRYASPFSDLRTYRHMCYDRDCVKQCCPIRATTLFGNANNTTTILLFADRVLQQYDGIRVVCVCSSHFTYSYTVSSLFLPIDIQHSTYCST